MSERNIGMEILEGLREIKAYKAGQLVLRTHKRVKRLRVRPLRLGGEDNRPACEVVAGEGLAVKEAWKTGHAETG
jgi:putative transcriptional regulator